MGMAASQARYLALVARRSNCEYEGQQINQARTALANQSADLFNQMLGLSVPTPPSTQDFTVMQYSFSDGVNDSVISNWYQLSEADPDYNYVVTHYYTADRYTGSMKKMNDPQVIYDESAAEPASTAKITEALNNINSTYDIYLAAQEATKQKEAQAARLENYAANPAEYTQINSSVYDSANDKYTINNIDGDLNAEFVGYNKLDETTQQQIDTALNRLLAEGAIDKINVNEVYYDAAKGDIAFREDINNLYNGATGGVGLTTTLASYDVAGISTKADEFDAEISTLIEAEDNAYNEYDEAVKAYEALHRPTHIGNIELNPLQSLTEDQAAELRQVCKDLNEQGIDANILDCFNANGDYTGGVYSFNLNGITYYTTYADLEKSYLSDHESNNNEIDSQPEKLAYYNATYVSTQIEKTEKALLETDSKGRFTTVKFESDSVTYPLHVEQVTDEAAYNDAMNQYYYKSAVYDKTIQDINAKTSIIQQQDQQLELKMKQLETEHNALKNEIEAVSKVVSENVEGSFKTFGG